jgi:hypothetical protein
MSSRWSGAGIPVELHFEPCFFLMKVEKSSADWSSSKARENLHVLV